MAGEELTISAVTDRGLLGDRVYALVDKASNRAATLRTWAAALLNYRAQFLRRRNREHPHRRSESRCRTHKVMTINRMLTSGSPLLSAGRSR